VGWLLALLAPRIVARNSRRYRQLELDEETLARSGDLIAQALAGGEPLTRAQIAGVLETAGIPASGQRAPYLLQRAALDGILCADLPRGRDPTYARLPEGTAPPRDMDREQALARLAEHYFQSHGPATVQDFAWWSGLTAKEARQGLEAVRSSLHRVAEGNQEMWAGPEPAALPAGGSPAGSSIYLLPPFDEYLLGYRDRSAVLAPEDAKKVNAGGGMPRPAVVVDGHVAGIWRRRIRRRELQVAVEWFRAPSTPELKSLMAAVDRLGAFWSMPVSLAGS
jgi:hypothetical protein